MRHIRDNTSAAEDAHVAIRRAVIALGHRSPSGALDNPSDALVKLHALLDGIYTELDHLCAAVYTLPRVYGALRVAADGVGRAATIAGAESRLPGGSR